MILLKNTLTMCRLLADDSSLQQSSYNVLVIEQKLNYDLHVLELWSNKWLLKFHSSKFFSKKEISVMRQIGVCSSPSPFGSIIFRWKKEWAGSHTPRSNVAWKCCIKRMAIPSIIVTGNRTENQFHLRCTRKIWPKFKTDINCSLKRSNQHFL